MQNKLLLENINESIELCEECKQLSKNKLVSKSRNIRQVLHNALDKFNQLDVNYQNSELLSKLSKLKSELVDFDDYIINVSNKPNTSTYMFLKLLVDMAKDEYAPFDGTKKDCKYDEIMQKAKMFNHIFEKGRSLAGCYDCGTIGRAVFMTYIKMKNDCYEISESSKKRNFKDVCQGFDLEKYNKSKISSNYSFPQNDNSKKRLNDLKNELLSGKPNIYICSISLSDGIGHIWVIESIGNEEYRIYQSSLNEYLLIDYLKFMNYNGRNNLKKSNIKAFLKNLDSLIDLNKWSEKYSNKYYEIFYHRPNIDYGTKFDFKFMYSGLY
jgi:hypothetical protein